MEHQSTTPLEAKNCSYHGGPLDLRHEDVRPFPHYKRSPKNKERTQRKASILTSTENLPTTSNGARKRTAREKARPSGPQHRKQLCEDV